mgnify:CR=1 FL=1
MSRCVYSTSDLHAVHVCLYLGSVGSFPCFIILAITSFPLVNRIEHLIAYLTKSPEDVSLLVKVSRFDFVLIPSLNTSSGNSYRILPIVNSYA